LSELVEVAAEEANARHKNTPVMMNILFICISD
jgi:hypothetical protein